MNEQRIEQIRANMEAIWSTKELLRIWLHQDHQEYSGEEYEAVRRILMQRGVDIPDQQYPDEVFEAARQILAEKNVFSDQKDYAALALGKYMRNAMIFAVVAATMILGYGSFFLLLNVSGTIGREGFLVGVFIVVGGPFAILAAAPVGFLYGVISPRSTAKLVLEDTPAAIRQHVDEYWTKREWRSRQRAEERVVFVILCLGMRASQWHKLYRLGFILALWPGLLGMGGGIEKVAINIMLIENNQTELTVEARGFLGAAEARQFLATLQQVVNSAG